MHPSRAESGDFQQPRLPIDGVPPPEGHRWIEIATLSEINSGEVLFRKLEGRSLIVSRSGDHLAVFDDRCPHAGTSLMGAEVDDGEIICPLHYASFDCRSGEAIAGPTTQSLTSHPCRLLDDRIAVALPVDKEGDDPS